MGKVCLAIIHNNDEQRIQKIYPCLLHLKSVLSERYEVDLFDISYQPDSIKLHTFKLAFLRDVVYHLVERRWYRYRMLVPRSFFRHMLSFLWRSLKTNRYSCDGEWLKSSSIQMIVAEKHIRAWGQFLETKGDFLICFEDDAIFTKDSAVKTNSLLFDLFRKSYSRAVYADLAGGCSVEELRVNKLEFRRDAYYRYYSKPVTNTACCYLMSRPLVACFHEFLIQNPWIRLIGVDWMINELFLKMEQAGIECECLHADPTIFQHGSFSGEYLAWQQKIILECR